jgi:peptidyl-prolyl cis-trans isomerase D
MIRFLQTPGPLKKYLLGGLLLLICISMVWYLVPSGGNSSISYSFGGPGKGVLALVDGNNITTDEVRQNARLMLQRQMPQGGANLGMLLPFFTQRAAEQLITRQALVAEALHLGLHATPEEVKDELQHGAYSATFFPGGNFIGQQEYEDFLQRNNLTASKFEADVRDEILINKLQAFIASGASVSEAEVHEQFIKQETKVKFDYAVLKQDDLKKGLHPTEEELKAYYESHKNTYANSVPEKRKVKYALVDNGKVEAGLQVTRDDLRAYYYQHRDEYRTPEQVKVSHIWIKMPLPGTDGKVDENKVAEAQHRADDLAKQLKNGAKFDDLAKKYSEDTVSAKVGGSLGWLGRGQLPSEVEKVAWSLAKGQISGVVKSSDGFHILRLDDKQDAHVKSLDEVKDQIEPILKQQEGQQVAQKEAEDLLAQARAHGLDAAAAAQGIPVITTDFFARKDLLQGLGPATQFMDAVFTEAEKSPPDVAPASQGTVVFQLLAVKPPATPTFEEIRSRVEEEFKNERSSILLSQKTAELSDRAKAEHDLKRAAKELGATMKTSDLVLPDGQVPDVGSMTGQAAVAFNMKPGEISGPISSGGNGVVLALLEKQLPTDADYAVKRDQIRDSLLQGKQQELFGLFVTSLREGMEKSGKIKINQDEYKALTRTGSEQGM